jgi:chemotaxis protein MotB
MTTFSDLNSLLLTFFVLLIAMASFDKIVVMGFMDSLLAGSKGVLNTRDSDESARQQLITSKQSSASSSAQIKQQAEKALQSYVEAQNLQQMVSIIQTDKGFTVRIMDVVLFQPGSYTILPAAFPVLDRIVSIAVTSPFYINIDGHTDDMPSGQYAASNWDLSANRALSVLKYMYKGGMPPNKLSATGFGEYHPYLPNITQENRAKNRRVEINFVSPEFFESSMDTEIK